MAGGAHYVARHPRTGVGTHCCHSAAAVTAFTHVMLDWHVDEEIPQDALSDEPPRRQLRIGWRTALLLLTLLLISVTVGIAVLRQREAALRAELDTHILQESRAMASGDRDLALPLVDPGAPSSWFVAYQSLFQRRATHIAPTVQEVELIGETATTMVRWATTPPLIEPRAYRLIEGTWRRTPLTIPTDQSSDLRTTHFALIGPPDAVKDLASTPGIQLNLEGLRRRVATYWQDTWDEYFLTVRVYPAEFAPAVRYADARNLHVNTVNLTPFDPTGALSPQSEYRLAVIKGVVAWLTTPDWVRAVRLNGSDMMSEADMEAAHDWFVMLDLLQEAEARHWALSEIEIERLQAQWRAEIGNQWVDPFRAPLPTGDMRLLNESDRQRRAMLHLMVERQVASGDISTIGRLARILNEYPPVYFSAEQFFSALIGGSPGDVQLQMELWLSQS